MQGVKIVFRSEDGRVLARRDGVHFNLPSAEVKEPLLRAVSGDDVRGCANDLLKRTTGKAGDLTPIFRGRDDEFGTSSSYLSPWAGSPKKKECTEWVDPRDVLLGKWGLFARDVFNALGWMNRPRLDLKKVYDISRKAIHSQSANSMDAIDMVMDEVALLLDIGKPWAVDAILREVDVRQLHADVIDALQTVVRDVEGLPSKRDFNRSADAQIAEVDKHRTKIRFGGHADVRSAALKMYRQKGTEFGQALRAGTLSAQFPYMRHIAEAEARMKEEAFARDDAGAMTFSGRPVVGFDEWPEEQRAAASKAPPRVDSVPKGAPKDSRGVVLEEPRRSTVVYSSVPHDLNKEMSPFAKQIRDAMDVALEGNRTEILFDEDSPDDFIRREIQRSAALDHGGPREDDEDDGPDEGPRWARKG